MGEGLMMETMLPSWVVILLAAGVGIGVAGLGLWVGCSAVKKLVRLIRRTLAADLRLQHLRRQRDREALNLWIMDSFRQKRLAEAERHRADQEAYNKRQIIVGAENLRREGIA